MPEKYRIWAIKKKHWLASCIATWEGLINEYFVPDIFSLLLY
jgi:hypothetical protein